ncbi:periplasmic heavy metal sensor [Henriciella sp.]|uniref:periplasmic heavy metal sensor n=1 Tax=Henriciella sp. TaxID=1968823 RepID=UPI00263693E5|nr:periplasmic heavy metal sensor [Henriciella sp.]
MTRQRTLSALSVVLVISLIANALLLGLVLGKAIGKPDKPKGPRGGGEEFHIARAMDDVVPEAARKDMQQAFRQTFRDSREAWDNKRAAREALTEAIVADPFDPEAVDAAFARMRAADSRLTERFQDVLSAQLSTLTVEQRLEMVSRLEEKRARRKEHHRRHKHEKQGRDGDRNDDPLPPPR